MTNLQHFTMQLVIATFAHYGAGPNHRATVSACRSIVAIALDVLGISADAEHSPRTPKQLTGGNELCGMIQREVELAVKRATKS